MLRKPRLIILFAIILSAFIALLAFISLSQQPTGQLAALPTLMALPSASPSPALTAALPTAAPVLPMPGGLVSAADSAVDFTAPPQAAPANPTPVPLITAISAPKSPVPNQVVITFNAAASPEQRAAYVQALGGVVTQDIAALNTVVVSLPEPAAASPLPPSPLVAAAEPDYYVTALNAPVDDPYYDQQWSLPVIGAPEGWNSLPAGAPAVTIAVIDSGVCSAHPDLQGRLLPGYDFVEGDDTPQDDFGHGCAVTGVIAANASNGEGIAGVAPNAQVMPLRVLDGRGIGTYSQVAAAVVYAADHGARIINLSLGGSSPSLTMQQALDYALARGVLVIAAAGNTGGAVLYPAAYAPVIAVAAVDPSLQRSSFSSYGPEVDLLAPGRDILTTSKEGGYQMVSGTSFAAPEAAGIAALELALGRTLALNGQIVRFAADNPPTLTPPPPGQPTATPELPAEPPALPIMRNPAAVYCTDLGYEYEIVPGVAGGEAANCVLPDGERCDQWAFYAGTCGADYSYCAAQGLGLVTLNDGRDPFAAAYAACTDASGQVLGSVNELSMLGQRALGCYDGQCPEPQAAPLLVNNWVDPAADWVSSISVPSSLDWRSFNGNWTTGVKNQSSCGSCWAFAAVGAAEAALKTSVNNSGWNPDLAEQDLISCGASGGCSGGNSESALRYMCNSGIVSESCTPYTASNSTCSATCSGGGSRASSLTFLASSGFTYSPTSNQYIKQNLVARGPVVVYMHAGGSNGGYFDGNGIYRCTNDYYSSGNGTIDHAVVAVGYNDAGGYWIIRNSWGATWNGDGHYRIGYDECNIGRSLVAYALNVPPPSNLLPANAAIIESRSVTVSWTAPATPLQNRYELRIGTSSNPNGSGWLVNTLTSATSYSYTFSADGTYYWHVRVSSGPNNDTARWVTRAFTVSTAPPPHDTFSAARLISGLPYSDSTKTSFATGSGDPSPTGCPLPGKTVWYKFTPTYSDTLTVSTAGSDFDTVLVVWRGTSLGALTQIACNDDYNSTVQSQATFNVTAGSTYYLMVGGYGSAGGYLSLNATARAVPDTAGLIAAINAANSSGGGDIYLVPGRVYTITSGGEFGLPPVVSGSAITLHGGGATIQRDPSAPAFRLLGVSAGGTLTLNDLILSGGQASNGGAVYNSGTLNLNNVTFSQNSADSLGGGLYTVAAVTGWNVRFLNNSAGYAGGGLYMVGAGASAFFSASEFSGNSAADGGGALKHDAGTTLTLQDSMIRDNSALHGGGLVIEGTAHIFRTTLLRNTAGDGGGGGINSGTLFLRDSFVRSNTARFGGGLINWVSATVERTTFADNIARSDGGWGGAIYTYGALNLTDCVLNNNRGLHGGALSNFVGAVTVRTSDFLYNTGTWGGAINNNIPLAGMGAQAVESAGPDGLAMQPTTPPQPPDGLELGVSAAGANKMTLIDVQIGHNWASYGGGLYTYAGTLEGENLHIHHNSARYNGGGLYQTFDGTIHLADSLLASNHATFNGGGGENYGVFSLENSRIEANTTGLYHGGGMTNYGTLTTSGEGVNFFVNNHAEGSGGAVFNSGVADIGGFFLGNSVYYDGGAIMNYGQMTLGGQLGSNRAGYNGGAVASVGGSLTVRYGTLIEYNEASYFGGGLYYQATSDSSSLSFNGPYPDYGRRTIFLMNQAHQGGAAYLKNQADSPLPVHLVEVEVVANEADDGGGIASEIPVSLTQSCVTGNSPTAVIAGAGAFITADGNWWGMADGASGAGVGGGDSISPNVSAGAHLTTAPNGCLPSNDSINVARVIPALPFDFSQSTVNAYLYNGDPKPSCGPSAGQPWQEINTVWYAYSAPVNGRVRLSTAGSDYNTLLSAWTGQPGALAEIACSDDAAGDDGIIEFDVQAGQTYRFMIADASSISYDGGQLTLHAEMPPLVNDDFSAALVVSAPSQNADYINMATAAGDDPQPSCGALGSKTAWYAYTAVEEAVVSFSTTGSDFNAVLSAWTGGRGALTETACVLAAAGAPKSIDLSVQPGQTIFIMVSGGSDAAGRLSLMVAPPLTAPVQVEPLPNSQVFTLQPTFRWNQVPTTVFYEIQYSTSPMPQDAPIISVTGNTFYKPPAALLSTTYYWRVRSVGGNNIKSGWSSVWPVFLVAPSNAMPVQNLFRETSRPTLAWSRVSWAARYEVQVATDPAFKLLVFSDMPTGLEITTSDLPNGIYYWRVRADKGGGVWSAWSAVGVFAIDVQ